MIRYGFYVWGYYLNLCGRNGCEEIQSHKAAYVIG